MCACACCMMQGFLAARRGRKCNINLSCSSVCIVSRASRGLTSPKSSEERSKAAAEYDRRGFASLGKGDTHTRLPRPIGRYSLGHRAPAQPSSALVAGGVQVRSSSNAKSTRRRRGATKERSSTAPSGPRHTRYSCSMVTPAAASAVRNSSSNNSPRPSHRCSRGSRNPQGRANASPPGSQSASAGTLRGPPQQASMGPATADGTLLP